MAEGEAAPADAASPATGSIPDDDGELTLFDPTELPSRDDGGLIAQISFGFQTEVTARFIVSMLRDDLGIRRVVCEHHEDFLVEKTIPYSHWELVSVKQATNAWSFSKLIVSGGIAHLFDRWLSCGFGTRARLCTNGKLSNSGTPSARMFATACGTAEDGEPVESVAIATAWEMINAANKFDLQSVPQDPKPPKKASDRTANAQSLPAGLLAAVKRFLSLLTIDRDYPEPHHLSSVNIMKFMRPTLNHCGWPDHLADPGYDRLIRAIEKANRNNDGLPRDTVKHLINPPSGTKERLAESVGRRTFTPLRAKRLVHPEAAVFESLTPLTPTAAPGSGQKLVAKMEDVSLGVEAIAYAQDTRGRWFQYESAVSSDFPDQAALRELLRLRIMQEVIKCKADLATTSVFPWRFIALLHERLTTDLLGMACPVGLDRVHVQGLAYEISNLCEFDFKPPPSIGAAT